MIMMKGDLKHLITLNNARDSLGNKEEVQEQLQTIEKTRKALIEFHTKASDFAQKAYNEDTNRQ